MSQNKPNPSVKRPVAHQFEDAGQQYDSSIFGMWVFLSTEVLFFGGALTAYAVYRWLYSVAFRLASDHLDISLGLINTAILIASSLTMVLAIHEIQHGNRKGLVKYLCATILLGGVFLAIKSFEYAHKFHEHLIPGPNFQFPEQIPGVQLFFSLYFALTGLHALHMIIGIVILGIMVFWAKQGRYDEHYNTPIEVMGLYWHFVDIVWIFLFPLLYLVGRHT